MSGMSHLILRGILEFKIPLNHLNRDQPLFLVFVNIFVYVAEAKAAVTETETDLAPRLWFISGCRGSLDVSTHRAPIYLPIRLSHPPGRQHTPSPKKQMHGYRERQRQRETDIQIQRYREYFS